ncbi:hypothetical protein BDR03DRAFT_1015483 [Suillus americanus]|nr:hypothetical protein BDR03DRAFT_1015483 [Suillus americanus]
MFWERTEDKPVIVIGARKRPDSLDAALHRAGRFDHEISLGVPNEEARDKILRVLCAKLRLDGDFNFAAFAKATPGYVDADVCNVLFAPTEPGVQMILQAVVREAGVMALRRVLGALDQMDDSSGGLIENQPLQRRKYDALRAKFADLPVRTGKDVD